MKNKLEQVIKVRMVIPYICRGVIESTKVLLAEMAVYFSWNGVYQCRVMMDIPLELCCRFIKLICMKILLMANINIKGHCQHCLKLIRKFRNSLFTVIKFEKYFVDYLFNLFADYLFQITHHKGTE